MPLGQGSRRLGIGGDEAIATGSGEYSSGSFGKSVSKLLSTPSSIVAKSEAGIVASEEISGSGGAGASC